MLDAPALAALWQIATELGIPPEASVPVLYIESTLSPSSHRQGSDFYGLNQISGRWLRANGVAPSDYLAWSAADQLTRTVLPYWRWAETMGQIVDAATCMWAQLAPASLSHAAAGDDAVVFASPSQEYTANEWLDVARDGVISLGDLRAVTSGAAHRPAVRATIAAAYASRGASPPSPAVASRGSSGGGAWLLAGAALGAVVGVAVSRYP